jgi:ankyrin repeat protein
MQTIKKLMLISAALCHSTLLFSAHEVNEELQRELLVSVGNGNFKMVRNALYLKADVNRGYLRGLSPLGIACCDLNLPMVEFLLANGADANGCNNNGYSVLHEAVISITPTFNAPVVGKLIAHRADVNKRGPDGVTPFARSYDRVPSLGFEETRALLIAAGARE